jgi:phosphotransferase system enzyme I (PtsI)
LAKLVKLVESGFGEQMYGSEDKAKQEIRMEGINASPGICIGKAYLVDREGVEVIGKYPIEASRVNAEKNRFKDAVRCARNDVKTLIDNMPDELRENAQILETHLLLLKDKMLYGKTLDVIEKDLVNAEWALKKVVAEVKDAFKSIQNSYFSERVSDIVHVSERIMRNLTGVKVENIADIDKRVILVAQDLSPADTSQINLEKIKGFVTDLGGKASHTSIIARTLEIPAVVGVGNATALIANDDLLAVDGNNGVVIIHPSEQTLIIYGERGGIYQQRKAELTRMAHGPARTIDGIEIQVMGNIELPEEVVSVRDHGGDGIGLYRTEFQYLNRLREPSEDELFEKYREVLEVMAPRPVTIRTLDIDGDKPLTGATGTVPQNPALGPRAIRYCLKKPMFFKTQLRALLRASAFGRTRIMVPMISSVEEVYETRRLLAEAAEELAAAGKKFNHLVSLGIMIEVPSAAIMADRLASVVDFFSIGTNDLIQYTLAVDRNNRDVAHLFNPLHPAILRLLKNTVDAAHKQSIGVFMCGQMAGDPLHVPILLGLGLDELSMNPQAIPAVKRMIQLMDMTQCRQMAAKVLKAETAAEVAQIVQDTYGPIVAEHLL